MAYQSRKRNYVSRREKFRRVLRAIRVILVFALLFLGALAMWNWNAVVFYWKTYFVY
jgi:hypothetical protein